MTRRPARRQTRANQPRAARGPRLPESVQVLTVERIAAGGDGVARADGLAVFVPRSAPGDVAQVAYVTHARHGRGRILQVLTPSPHRVTPPCVHYERDRCGGCQLQHLDGASQRQARQQIVQDSLRRIGRRDIDLPELDHAAEWGYRSRLTLTLRRTGQGWVGGFHAYDDATRVFALDTCLIAHPTLADVWGSLRPLLRQPDLTLPGQGTPQGGAVPIDAVRLSLRLDGGDDGAQARGVQLVVEGGTVWPGQDAWAEAARRADARVRGVWWTPERPFATGSRVARHESAAATVDYLPQAREALAFAQVNADVAGRLRDHVFEAVRALTPGRVLDGYAGTGLFSARLAAAGIPVIAVESDPAGADNAVARLAATGGAGDRSHVMCDVMERALGALEAPVDVVVLNPPRRGVHPDVTSWLEAPAQRLVRGLVYVSCDPATLARDLARLPSWRVERVQCFDMFPQTAHVETVCTLLRESA